MIQKSTVLKLQSPFQKFFQQEAFGGLLLLIATAVALFMANSQWAGLYGDIWHTKITFQFHEWLFSKDLHFWINDGLMAIFFFVLGLELKREFLIGELSSRQYALLPVVAAIGGVTAPVLIFLAFNPSETPAASGWGIPMATDTAFALGILALFGKTIPTALKVLLTAIIVIDDLLAIMVITFFYNNQLQPEYLFLASAIFIAMLIVSQLGVQRLAPYLLLSILLWLTIYQSGIHGTIAGVLAAITIPLRPEINTSLFYERCHKILRYFKRGGLSDESYLTTPQHQLALHWLITQATKVESLHQRLIRNLHGLAIYFIMPIFVLANAGFSLSIDNLQGTVLHAQSLGIIIGLCLGKPLGIILSVYIAKRLSFIQLPLGVTWMHMVGLGCLCGIGFTMAIFITILAYHDANMILSAKFSILSASTLSAILAGIFLTMASKARYATHNSPASSLNAIDVLLEDERSI